MGVETLIKNLENNDSKTVHTTPRVIVNKRSDEYVSEHLQNYLDEPVALARVHSLNLEEVGKVIEAVVVIMELYTIFGFTQPRLRSWVSKKALTIQQRASIFRSNQVLKSSVNYLLRYVATNGEGSWVKFLKWKTAAFFAFYRSQELPPKPCQKFDKLEDYTHLMNMPYALLGGEAHNFLMSLQAKDYERFMQFTDSSLYLKKGMPRVPDSMIEKSINDTVEELTGIPKVMPDQMIFIDSETRNPMDRSDQVFVSKQKVIMALRRTTSELFENECFTHDDVFEPFFPSTSANYNWSRGKCGALGELYYQGFFGERVSGIEFGFRSCSVFGKSAIHYGGLGKHEQYLYACENQCWGEQLDIETCVMVDPTDLKMKWRETYTKIWSAAQFEKPYVAPVGLAEPLKVRVIIKGPPLLYTALKPFQKWMWGVLKKHPVFQLIGRPVTEDDVNRLLFGMPGNHEVVSGDYVSSTNRLHSWVSETILDELMICIGEQIDLDLFPPNFMVELKSMFLKALTKHIFVVDSSNSEGGLSKTEKNQTEGQLMGSIVSFPFLCIANAALCRLAMEEADGKVYQIKGKKCPLLVNGDDCLLRGTKRLRPVWEQFCSLAGLSSSVGKTYFSNSFCTINSEIFQKDHRTGIWEARKYVNLGLVFGRSRVLTEDNGGGAPTQNLGTISRDLKRTCPKELWLKVKKQFIHHNRVNLVKYPGIPWFIPEWLGGLGLPVDHESERPENDRKIASYIKNNMKSCPKLRPVAVKDMPFWLMHKEVLKDEKILGLEKIPSEGNQPRESRNFKS